MIRKLPPLFIVSALVGMLAPAFATPCRAVERQDVDAAFERHLNDLADRCATLDLPEQAKTTRRWWIPRDPQRQYLFLPAERDAHQPADDAPLVVQQWYRKFTSVRQTHAAELFALARQALEDGRPAVAYQLLHEVLHEDPDHTEATRILGGRRYGRDVNVRVRAGRSPHPAFGWARGSYWRVDSPHFQITTNHSGQAGKDLALQLEELYSVWQQVFFPYWSTGTALAERFDGRAAVLGRPRRHEVILFRDREDYVQTLTPLEPQIAISTGYYLGGQATAYFYAGEPALRDTWLHETTHQLFQEQGSAVEDVGVQHSFWLVEGIAVYMESLQSYGPYATTGGFDANRLQYARARRLGGSFYMPLAELEAFGRDPLRQHEEIRKLYTQAAGLTHFLMDGKQAAFRDATLQYLQLLYLGRNQPGILEALTRSSYTDLDEAYAEFLQVTDRDLVHVGPADQIVKLALGRTQVTNAGLGHLDQHDQLQWLDLSFTPIDNEGLAQLPPQSSLVQCSLESTAISDAAMSQIATWTSLEELDLSQTAITDEGARHLRHLRNLRVLWLTETEVSDDVLDVLRQLDQLEFVDVGGSRVSPAAWEAFAKRLKPVDR